MIRLLGVLLFAISIQVARADANTDIYDMLFSHDSEYLTNFHLSMDATLPTDADIAQGNSKARIEISGTDMELALSLTRTEIENPRYISENSNSYDNSMNYIFNYDKTQLVHLGF